MIAIANQPPESETVGTRDCQLRLDAAAALAASQYGSLRRLICRVTEGVVEISGEVPSYYLKQLAQTAVLQLYPSCVLRNHVRVVGDHGPSHPGDCEA